MYCFEYLLIFLLSAVLVCVTKYAHVRFCKGSEIYLSVVRDTVEEIELFYL